jgi:hypothetical protein
VIEIILLAHCQKVKKNKCRKNINVEILTLFILDNNMSRNLPCIPSDDESNQEDDNSIYSSSDDESISKPKNGYVKTKIIVSKLKSPLPSDEDTGK